MRVVALVVAVFVCTTTASAAAPSGPQGPSGAGSMAPTPAGDVPVLPAADTSDAAPIRPGPVVVALGTEVPQTGGGTGPVAGPGTVDPAGTNLTVRLRPNGDAVWNVSIAVPLAGSNETRAFRDLADRHEAGRADVGPSIAPFERAIDAASAGTDREMTLLDVSRSARIENGTGYLTLRFLWTNFATESGGRLRVGDAFRTPRGTWLPGLATNQTFVIVPPSGYGVNSAPIGPDNGTLRWEGPEEFEPGYLSVTYRRGLAGRTTTTATATATTTPPPDAEEGLVPIASGAALGIGLLVAMVLYARSRGTPLRLGATAADGTDADSDSYDTSGANDPPADAEVDASDESPGSAAADSAAAGTAATGDGTDGNGGVDEELLSDEERVERLLEANGGRMRQAVIVTETQWSNAKVSQLLSAMDRADRIDKLRIGRENLISLPDADTSDADTSDADD
jgi:hypothetical protein